MSLLVHLIVGNTLAADDSEQDDTTNVDDFWNNITTEIVARGLLDGRFRFSVG